MQQRSFFLPITTMFIIMALLLTLVGCNFPTKPGDIEMNMEFTIGVGEELSVKGEPIRIFFQSVPEDSRCPERASCVWEGSAETVFEIRSTADPFPVSLHTYKGDPDRYPTRERFMNYEIELLQLNPYPVSGGTIPQEVYKARLRLRRAHQD